MQLHHFSSLSPYRKLSGDRTQPCFMRAALEICQESDEGELETRAEGQSIITQHGAEITSVFHNTVTSRHSLFLFFKRPFNIDLLV